MLKGKTVVIGVCGGIAAYKVVEVASRLVKLNAEVHVVMTANAQKFVAPLTFQTISRNPVITDMFAEPKSWDVQHISLAVKADLFVVAPATANIIGKVANGIADDMLTTTLMATKAPILFVPAMNTGMYENPILQENLSKLEKHGCMVMKPDTGLMACGTSGIGRLPEPDAIVEKIKEILYPKNDLKGFKVLITAGPTREAIDPVRFISNYSSGKMGYAVAEAALKRGAEVKLISGPVNIKAPSGAQVTYVNCADDMYKEVLRQYEECDIMIFMAAVADYKCANIKEKKLKKTDDKLTLELIKNPDIAKELGKLKGSRIHVGACAETDNLEENALSKINSKNFDLIMANDVTMEGAGFGVDTNIVKFIRKNGSIRELPLMKKSEVADELLNEIVEILKNKDDK